MGACKQNYRKCVASIKTHETLHMLDSYPKLGNWRVMRILIDIQENDTGLICTFSSHGMDDRAKATYNLEYNTLQKARLFSGSELAVMDEIVQGPTLMPLIEAMQARHRQIAECSDAAIPVTLKIPPVKKGKR